MANTKLTINLTPKVVKVTAHVELHDEHGNCIGTTTVDLTPQDESTTTSYDINVGDDIPSAVAASEQRLAAARLAYPNR